MVRKAYCIGVDIVCGCGCGCGCMWWLWLGAGGWDGGGGNGGKAIEVVMGNGVVMDEREMLSSRCNGWVDGCKL